jgi:hypothetical protein
MPTVLCPSEDFRQWRYEACSRVVSKVYVMWHNCNSSYSWQELGSKDMQTGKVDLKKGILHELFPSLIAINYKWLKQSNLFI